MSHGPRLISESVPRVAGQAFGRKYIMLGRLVTHWPDIVGEDMAALVQPIALKYRSGKKKDAKAGDKPTEFTLEIATDNAAAMVMRYRTDLILARINQIFGADWITAIRFVPKATDGQRNNRFAKPPKPLTPDQKQSLSNMLKDVPDPELQERLQRLGSAIWQDHKS
ncbi:MAG: DUF721 domain-containing protein [Alphaproteobacteria bacterium]|jgi:hypothetical protein|nr:DUF721 domain-containing protein [Alphaproteobacteria bacterium]